MKITFNPTIKIKCSRINACNPNFCRGKKAIYAIDYEGNYEKLESMSDVKNATPCAISSVLSEKCAIKDNKTYIYAHEAELPDGKVDTSAIYRALSRFQDAQNQPIYVIDFNGNIQRFDNRKQASVALNIYLGSINQALNQTLEAIHGYVFIKAFDVELRDKNGKLLKDENNNPILDKEAINKLRENFLYIGRDFPIVSIDKEGNITHYQNIKEASLKTNNKRANIAHSITSKKTTQEKCVFARLGDVVLVDKFGDVVFDCDDNYVIDYNKIEKIRQNAFKK